MDGPELAFFVVVAVVERKRIATVNGIAAWRKFGLVEIKINETEYKLSGHLSW